MIVNTGKKEYEHEVMADQMERNMKKVSSLVEVATVDGSLVGKQRCTS